MGITYDTGALIAATGQNAASGPATVPCWRSVKCPPSPRRRGTVVARRRPPGSAGPAASWMRLGGPRRRAGPLRRLARRRAATTDIVDACVVEGAMRRHDLVVTSDPDDLQAIAAAVSRRLEIDRA